MPHQHLKIGCPHQSLTRCCGKSFAIEVRDTSGVIASFTSLSNSSGAAEVAARDRYDIPVGITVRPA